jgi:DNA adenine methylase
LATRDGHSLPEGGLDEATTVIEVGHRPGRGRAPRVRADVPGRGEGDVSVPDLKAPFPWFGGKSRVSNLVWERFGADVPNYIEPFFGSGAVLLGRPGGAGGVETVNDKDGMIANFWRAIAADPESVAAWCDWPCNENDMHARHAWLVGQRADLVARLEGDPGFYDAKIAGWWCWGICLWIGNGWCSGRGPWIVEDGRLVRRGDEIETEDETGQLAHLGTKGQGINRKLMEIGGAGCAANLRGALMKTAPPLLDWFAALSSRLRRVRVCSGDWSRICGPSPTVKIGTTAVFLDPPYSAEAERTTDIYAQDDASVANDVRAWCREHGNDPALRIALCGYAGEHDELEALGWDVVAWKARGGYGSQGSDRGRENAARERIWFSPHCLSGKQGRLF